MPTKLNETKQNETKQKAKSEKESDTNPKIKRHSLHRAQNGRIVLHVLCKHKSDFVTRSTNIFDSFWALCDRHIAAAKICTAKICDSFLSCMSDACDLYGRKMSHFFCRSSSPYNYHMFVKNSTTSKKMDKVNLGKVFHALSAYPFLGTFLFSFIFLPWLLMDIGVGIVCALHFHSRENVNNANAMFRYKWSDCWLSSHYADQLEILALKYRIWSIENERCCIFAGHVFMTLAYDLSHSSAQRCLHWRQFWLVLSFNEFRSVFVSCNAFNWIERVFDANRKKQTALKFHIKWTQSFGVQMGENDRKREVQATVAKVSVLISRADAMVIVSVCLFQTEKSNRHFWGCSPLHMCVCANAIDSIWIICPRRKTNKKRKDIASMYVTQIPRIVQKFTTNTRVACKIASQLTDTLVRAFLHCIVYEAADDSAPAI